MRILVVEDEKEISQFLKKALTAEFFAVDVADDGERGSFLARTNNYDLIVLDNMLPGKTGLEVCKEIRESGKTMPIIILSVQSETTTKVNLLNAGADDYLIKPFSLKELLARIQALLRRPLNIQQEIITIDGLTMDTKKHQVKRGGKEVRLTSKEFALLKCLMENAGIVLSRSMIMEHAWDMNIDPFSNTIDAHIVSLRRKISVGGKRKLIHSIHGRGYKIDTQP